MTDHMIRRFIYQGEFFEPKLIQTKESCRKNIEADMRDNGFVPLLDVNPMWSTKYIQGERFWFQYTWQGVFIGKDEAWQIAGVMDGKKIPYSQRTK